MDTKKYQVMIVGGGPSGSLTALSLLRLRPELAGEILLLEARDFPREKVCGGGVSGRVTTALESLGISLEGLPRVPVKRFCLHFEKEISRPGFGNDLCFVARRSAFDALLLEEAAKRGTEVRTLTPAVGAYRERRGVAVLDAAGGTHRAEVLVGADGVNGRSRRWFGLPRRGRKFLLLQAEFPRRPGCGLLDDSLLMDFGVTRFGIPGYAWFFPSLGADGEPVVNAGISGGDFGKRSYRRLKGAFLAALEHHPEIKATAPASIRFRPYPEGEYSPLQVEGRDRVIFVGEQLGVDPFSGEGLAVCADSAGAAAAEIAEALEKGDFSFGGYGRRIRTARFFPLYALGKIYSLQNRWVQPNFFFVMATRRKEGEKRNVVDYYASTFSGAEESTVLYSPAFWGTVARDAAVTLPGWVGSAGKALSSRG